MGDVICSVCGEPYDYHHINHDTPQWISKLFRAGKGCESCEGARPKGADFEAIGRAILNDIDDGDKLDRIERACSEKSYEHLWVKPPPRVLAKCEGCDLTAEIDEDDIYPYRKDGKDVGHVVVWQGDSLHGNRSRTDVPLDELKIECEPGGFGLTDLDSDWEFNKVLDKLLCKNCWTRCDKCEAELYNGEAQSKFCSDTYDAGNSFYEQDDDKTYCVECYESRPHCAQCEQDFDHDTEMSHEGLCKECQREKDKVECADCRSKVDPDDLTEMAGCGRMVCWECEDGHEHRETTPGHYEHGDLLLCTECKAEINADEAIKDGDKLICVDCQIVKENADEQ